MPSPGRPKTTVTPQSIRRSANTSAAVRAMVCSRVVVAGFSRPRSAYGGHLLFRRDCKAGAWGFLLLTLEDPRDRADELLPHRPSSPIRQRDFAALREIRSEI